MSWAVVQYLAIIAVAGVLLWLPSRVEVHWVARDGRRLICRGQLRDHSGTATTPWREYRLQLAADGDVVAYRRSLLGGRRGGTWRVAERADGASGRHVEFVLRPLHEAAGASTLVIRVPAGSRAVALLDGLAQPMEPGG